MTAENLYGLKNYSCPPLYSLHRSVSYGATDNGNSLYDNIRKRIPRIEYVNGKPDHLNDQHYINVGRRNLLVFDDLMTEAKCDQRIADLFTKGSHHRNISVVYLTKKLFPQGKACRDIILNTQYMVLYNNPIDRQQEATLARRIYPSTSTVFMKRFEQATT